MTHLPACSIADGAALLPRIEPGKILGKVVAKDLHVMFRRIRAEGTP